MPQVWTVSLYSESTVSHFSIIANSRDRFQNRKANPLGKFAFLESPSSSSSSPHSNSILCRLPNICQAPPQVSLPRQSVSPDKRQRGLRRPTSTMRASIHALSLGTRTNC